MGRRVEPPETWGRTQHVAAAPSEWEWAVETIDPAAGTFASLHLFPSDTQAAVAYYDETDGDLRYAYHDGTMWHRETVDAPDNVGSYASLALNGAGFPRIAYYDETNGNLKYAFWTGISWNTVTVDATGDVGAYASLALYNAGFPCIAYYDASAGALKYAWNDGAIWHKEAVEPIPSGNVGRYASLALDGAGFPHIAYYDETNGNLKYARKDTQGWHPEVVDEVGDVGRYASLALDSSDLPHIAYYDATNGDLKYAYHDGTMWHTEVVDAQGNVGRYASLALDASDLPHIAYYDGTNGDLRYAHDDGSAWHFQTVYASGIVGQYASLSLDTQGRPYIAFYDDSEGDLKWAYICTPPAASFEVSPAPYCVGETLSFTNTTVSTWTVSFLWSFGDGVTSTLRSPEHTYAVPGLYEAVLTAETGCGTDAFSRTLPVWGEPAASFVHSHPACVDRPIFFTSTSQVSGTASYAWEFGDKTGVVTGTTHPAHVYTATGTYPVTLMVQNECGLDASQEYLTVTAVPEVSFEHGPNPSCGQVTFTNTTSGGTSFLWDFGDGTTSTETNPVHTYASGGFYTVTLTAWGVGGCADTAASTQEIWTGVHGVETGVFPSFPVPGEVVTFTATARGTPPIAFTWDLGDGEYGFGPVVTHTYATTGTFTVLLTAANACGASRATLQVEVISCTAPAGLVLTYAPRPLLRGRVGIFTATLSAGSAPVHYLWSFGDDTPPVEGAVVQHAYAAAGRYTATLSAWNDCGSRQGVLPVEVNAPLFRVYLPQVARNQYAYAGDEFEPDGLPEQAGALLLAQPQRHTFAPQGDVDWVYLDLTAGTAYAIETRDLAGGADTILDLYVTGYYDSPLAHSDDDCGGYAACLEFVPPVSGRYHLRVTNYPGGARWGPDVQYTLQVTSR
ncbi:MAG: PKD domain-containing protein [Chloroflexia bacterium]